MIFQFNRVTGMVLLVALLGCSIEVRLISAPFLHEQNGQNCLRWQLRTVPYWVYSQNRSDAQIYLWFKQVKRLSSQSISSLLSEQIIAQVRIVSAFDFTVRVLLAEHCLSDAGVFQLSSPEGFYLIDPARPMVKGTYTPQKAIVQIIQKALHIDGQRIRSKSLLVEPINGRILFDGKTYNGLFEIVSHNNRLLLINRIDLESYISSVLRSESWPGWPVEVNKAFAIACRSYLVSRITEAVKLKRPYHIKNYNIHQTYDGVHEIKAINQAVGKTRGVILTWNGKPVDAMFDACCGGITPQHIEGVNFARAPYLARSYACTFCKPSKIHTWHVQYSSHDLKKLLSDETIALNQIKDIQITKRDGAGLVTEVMIKDTHRQQFITGKQCYSICSKIKSFAFDVCKKGDVITFSGKGYGHHLGVCQWGAKYMVDAGWDYKRILQFYYPGVSFSMLCSL